jgi:hypothetical protein
MQLSGQHASTALLPGKEPPVSIGQEARKGCIPWKLFIKQKSIQCWLIADYFKGSNTSQQSCIKIRYEFTIPVQLIYFLLLLIKYYYISDMFQS